MAPIKGTMSNRILLGHLLGLVSRHSCNGSGLGLCGPPDMHLLGAGIGLLVKSLECNVRWVGWICGSSRARVRRIEDRNGGMTGQLQVGMSKSYDETIGRATSHDKV
jgi:hypothetical protein